jgi:hypothetical protein
MSPPEEVVQNSYIIPEVVRDFYGKKSLLPF